MTSRVPFCVSSRTSPEDDLLEPVKRAFKYSFKGYFMNDITGSAVGGFENVCKSSAEGGYDNVFMGYVRVLCRLRCRLRLRDFKGSIRGDFVKRR